MVDQKLKKRAIHRTKIIMGQVKGLTQAIEKEQYCIELLNQSLSIQRSLKSLDALLLENHLKTHVQHQMRATDGIARAVTELIKIYHLASK
ncbi:MAG: metal-sensitive transcriptional regulator [Patescibacteria group bacterium]